MSRFLDVSKMDDKERKKYEKIAYGTPKSNLNDLNTNSNSSFFWLIPLICVVLIFIYILFF